MRNKDLRKRQRVVINTLFENVQSSFIQRDESVLWHSAVMVTFVNIAALSVAAALLQ